MMSTNNKISVMWTNNATHTRPMSRHRITFRNDSLTCRKLHLDQIHIIFRPTTDIAATEFIGNDDNTKSWQAETMQLLVRTTPGVHNTLFTVDPNTPAHVEAISQPNRSVVYSSALSVVTNNPDSGPAFWCRTYRPVRDLPVAVDLDHVSELGMELFFPVLFGNRDNQVVTYVPDYRILKVYVEFSIDNNGCC